MESPVTCSVTRTSSTVPEAGQFHPFPLAHLLPTPRERDVSSVNGRPHNAQEFVHFPYVSAA